MIRHAILLLGWAALAGSLAIAADDPIAKKLDEAKANYHASLEKARTAIRDWFDKREDAARKDGNKKQVDQVKSERKAYEDKRELPKSAPPALSEAFAAARKAMEGAYNTAVKEYTQAKKDDEANAVEKHLEKFKKSGSESSDNPDGLDLTADVLKAKFAGKATYDPKTGVLAILYRFGDAKELQDFDCGDLKPRVFNNALRLNGGEKIRHVVQFDTLAVTGVIGVREMKGMVLTTTAGTAVGVGGAGKDGIYLATNGKQALDQIVPANLRKGSIRFGVSVTEKRALLVWGDKQLGREIAEPGAGQVDLLGGESGFLFGSLTIAGKPNATWAQKFFAEK